MHKPALGSTEGLLKTKETANQRGIRFRRDCSLAGTLTRIPAAPGPEDVLGAQERQGSVWGLRVRPTAWSGSAVWPTAVVSLSADFSCMKQADSTVRVTQLSEGPGRWTESSSTQYVLMKAAPPPRRPAALWRVRAHACHPRRGSRVGAVG